MAKEKVAFQEIAERIAGISLPVCGVTWNPPEPERKIVRETFIFLDDCRALCIDLPHESVYELAHSVLEIHSKLSTVLKRLPKESEAVASIKVIRTACRHYLGVSERPNQGCGDRIASVSKLDWLRAVIGIHVAYLAVKYGIDIDGNLMRVMPPELRDAKYVGL